MNGIPYTLSDESWKIRISKVKESQDEISERVQMQIELLQADQGRIAV